VLFQVRAGLVREQTARVTTAELPWGGGQRGRKKRVGDFKNLAGATLGIESSGNIFLGGKVFKTRNWEGVEIRRGDWGGYRRVKKLLGDE